MDTKIIECPLCNQNMITQEWTQDLKVCTCNTDKIRKYWSLRLGRFLNDDEINQIGKVWE